MKSTKIMLACIACFVTTWLSISLIGYMLSDATFKTCATNGGTMMFMFILGWVPAFVVGIDLDKKLNNF